MLGTDYPFPLGELEPGSLIESMEDFDNALKVKQMHNALFKMISEECGNTFNACCCLYITRSNVLVIVFFLFQERLLADNALEFLGLRRQQFE